MANIVIIGNGFDLAHGLKTGYTHFIEDLVKQEIATNRIRNKKPSVSTGNRLIEFSNNKKLKEVKSFGHLKQSIITSNVYDLPKFNNKFLEVLVRNFALENWCDIEELYFQQLLGDKFDNPKMLNSNFDEIRNRLEKYLFLESKRNEDNRINELNDFFKHIRKFNSLILSFNYTNTLDRYESIRDLSVLYLHGKLECLNNPIIFGYAANDEESRELIKKNDNELMRNIKKHCYKRTNQNKKLINFIANSKKIDVFILGHSCGLSDKLILNQILNDSKVNSINLFYYNNYFSFFDQQVNIDRIMNNDENFKKLINFEDSQRMPQITDGSDLNDSFKQFIENFNWIQEVFIDTIIM